MRSQKVDDFARGEARVGETGKDGVDGVGRSWDEAIQSGSRCIGPTSEELEARRTGAVGETNCSSEVDQVSCRDVVAGQERRKGVGTVTGTVVLCEIRLDGGEENDRSISAITNGGIGEREGNPVVEGQTKRLMNVFAALIVEEIRLQVVAEREESTAL